MLLKIDNISLSYGDKNALNGVSFALEDQARALLLGPSGSGKSSLLNVICGLKTPDAGHVRLDENVIASADGDAQSDALRKEHLGIIFQTLRLVSALDVRGNLLLAQRLQRGRTNGALVEETLERLGLGQLAKSRPHELSQGEAQRAAIARAVVVRPAIVIADEPTSALDADNTDKVARLLIESAEEAGASLLIATHDDRLRAHFDQTFVLSEGRIAA